MNAVLKMPKHNALEIVWEQRSLIAKLRNGIGYLERSGVVPYHLI